MKNKLLGGVAAVVLAASMSTSALAAPPAPAFSWTGCYVGGHAGYSWGHQNWDGTSSGGFLTTVKKLDMNGALYGGQIGCDYQIPGSAFVIGLDGAFSWTKADGNATDGYSTGYLDSSKQKNLGIFGGRIGWAGLGPHLIYLKAGWAKANFDFKNDYSGDYYTGSNHRNGFAIGGGWEWLVWKNVSLFVEYVHIDLGNKKEELGGYFADIDIKSNSVKGGLNFRFGQ